MRHLKKAQSQMTGDSHAHFGNIRQHMNMCVCACVHVFVHMCGYIYMYRVDIFTVPVPCFLCLPRGVNALSFVKIWRNEA